MAQVVSLSFYRFDRVLARAWAFAMMGVARPALARMPDIGFWKLCGSGAGEGFDVRPNTRVYAVLATWPNLATAQHRHATDPLFKRYRKRAVEDWTVYLSTDSVRGEWSGRKPFDVSEQAGPGPLAVLTRATLRPGMLPRFWGRVPNISDVIGKDPNVLFKIGIGNVPLLQQVTFSIWPNAQLMAAFARTGPHAEAIRAVRAEGWFREELYARFTLLSEEGTWGGSSPLQHREAI
ncbi:MAG: spheroidene monooxygenase [Pseudomonadota bacterium]